MIPESIKQQASKVSQTAKAHPVKSIAGASVASLFSFLFVWSQIIDVPMLDILSSPKVAIQTRNAQQAMAFAMMQNGQINYEQFRLIYDGISPDNPMKGQK